MRLLFALLMMLMCGRVWGADEILNARTYNQKVYDLGAGKKQYKIHIAQIHYKDGLDYKDIDTRLTQDAITKQWKTTKASYHPIIPEYADGVFEFYNAYEGANHTLKAIPQCNHVKGEYFENADGNYVLYKDAFGAGIDLKVYAYWAGLKKVIIINQKPADTTKALTFDFELILPAPSKDKVKDKNNNLWDKSTKLDFKSKNLKIGDEGKESYFRDARVWDSGEFNQSIDIELYAKDGKTYLRKTITPEILTKATYPLYTDHPTSYYAGAGDGQVGYQYVSVDWDLVHDATNGSSVNYTSTYSAVGIVNSAGPLDIYRGFFPIDTSGIDDSATITEAIFYVYANSKFNFDNDGDDWQNIVHTSQASYTELVTEDYDQCGAVNNPEEGCDTRADMTDIVNTAYTSFVLSATGISWIDKTGISYLGMREGHDAIDSLASNRSCVIWRFSEYTGTNCDPYLEVTTTSEGSSTYYLGTGIGVGIGHGILN